MNQGRVSLSICACLLVAAAGCQSASMKAGSSPALGLEYGSPTTGAPIQGIRQAGATADETRPVELSRYEEPAQSSSWSRLLDRFATSRPRPVSLPRTDIEPDDVFAEQVVHETEVSDDF
jgi:hypothetical protein